MKSPVHIERLEPRTLLAGVTVITHGFQTSSGLPNWLASMETALSNRMGGANIYRMTITGGSSPTVSSFSRISSGGTANAESIIDVNWSAVANNFFYPSVTAATIANLVKPYLTTALNLSGDPLTTRPFAELPLHIGGHSRGASLVADLARKLAADGLWVDGLTLWDPHPVGSDPAVSVSDNVVFSDNVYQDNAFPDGAPVSGAHNINLTGVSGVGHSETHAYYYGTINRAATSDGDGITINNNWYSGAGAGPRWAVEYDWSRIGSGTRPSDGISNLAGGAAARTHITVTASTPWSNLGSVDMTGDAGGFIADNLAVGISYRYQDSAGGGSASFYLDNNSNPYDGFARSYGSTASLAATGATPNVSSLLNFPITWTSSGLSSGMYRVAAKLMNAAGLTRYVYMIRPLYVTSSGAEVVNKRWTNDLADNSWTQPSNFTPGGLVAASNHVLVPAGATSINADVANASLIVGASASVTFNSSQHLGGLTVASGAAATLTQAGNRLIQTPTLKITGTGKLDLSDNDLIVDKGSFSQIQSWIVQGFNSTSGITSSTSNGTQILAAFDNALVGTSNWNGQTISANAIVGKYTYFGDVNFDGQVTGDDYAVIDSNLNTIPPAGLAWLSGDANLDGQVTGDDYATIDANLGLGATNPLASVGATPASPSLEVQQSGRRRRRPHL